LWKMKEKMTATEITIVAISFSTFLVSDSFI